MSWYQNPKAQEPMTLLQCLEDGEEVAPTTAHDNACLQETDRAPAHPCEGEQDVQEMQSINGDGVGCDGGTPEKEPKTLESRHQGELQLGASMYHH